MIEHDIPIEPWSKVGTDVFHLFRKHYVLVVDYTSKYFEISQLPDVESSTVINHIKSIFARHGIPETVVSDNGPEYKSFEFKTFAKEWEFDHDPSSPEYPQSNGLVECTIQTVKKTMKKL